MKQQCAVGIAVLLMSLGAAFPSAAQVGNFGYGSSAAAGSGGTPTGASNLGGIYGLSSAAGSGGTPTGLTDLGTLGYGISTSGGPGGVPTGTTNPTLPQFPAAMGVANPVARAPTMPAIGLPSVTATPGVVNGLPSAPGPGSVYPEWPATHPPPLVRQPGSAHLPAWPHLSA